nr:LLM class flavin-dependent oxidoreductase [Micromonospora sp. DSM 115978]
MYRLETGLASRAEEVGFDSVWLSEHHFSDYQLTSQQSMVLAWIAGQTSRVKLGTMVTVLPWH